MRSDIKNRHTFERFYIECSCRCNNMIVLDVDIRDDWVSGVSGLASIAMHYDHRVGFFRRLWRGVQYIIRGKDLIMWDEILIDNNNIHQLEEFINYVKEVHRD